MTQQELNDLIDKVNTGTATAADLRLYTAYLNHITSGDEAWDIEALGTEESVKQELHNRIALIRKPIEIKKVKLWPRIVAVAAAVAAIVFGIWFYNYELTSSLKAPRNDGMVMNDITPGKNTATLTLANGKTITLSDAKTGVVIDANSLKYNDGTTLSGLQPSLPEGERNGMMLTASTPRGGTYQFTLPDGTQVWLNAASKISFPSQFSGATRKILLSGEAYFEVSKNKAKPFIVESNGQQVEVLGTHFNINAYGDEGNTKTTLLEGSVKVSVSSLSASSLQGGTTRQPHDQILKPGEQAANTGTTIQVTQVDVNTAIAWKNGRFIYKDTPLDIVMRQLSRWYDINITYTDDALKNERFSGSLSRYDNVSRILNTIAFTGVVKFKIEGKNLIITK